MRLTASFGESGGKIPKKVGGRKKFRQNNGMESQSS
jgi:hypothetical protein